jgi:hypothetical protein
MMNLRRIAYDNEKEWFKSNFKDGQNFCVGQHNLGEGGGKSDFRDYFQQ